jgi:hypothetical protein
MISLSLNLLLTIVPGALNGVANDERLAELLWLWLWGRAIVVSCVAGVKRIDDVLKVSSASGGPPSDTCT